MEIHLTTMECHLPYGITQCYLPPDTSEHTPPLPQPDRLVLVCLEDHIQTINEDHLTIRQFKYFCTFYTGGTISCNHHL